MLSDAGRSASRYAKSTRPAWEEVKHRIASDGIDVLVLWEASRSTRDLASYVELRDLCRRHGVKLSYSGRTLDFDDSTDSFRGGLDALISEDESERTRKRVLRTMRANAAAGRPHGRRLYGYKRIYDLDPKTGKPKLVGQEPEPDEAAVVQDIARRYVAGESTYSIVADLNARGVRLPSGAKWSARSINRMLTNPAYIGKRVHHGQVADEVTWPPLLDQRTFHACAARYDDPARAKYRGGTDVKYLVSGIARCGLCGAALYVGGSPAMRLYVCHDGNGHISRNQQHLDAYVTVVILEWLAAIDLDDLTAEAPEAKQARAEAAKLRRRLDKALDQFTDGKLSAGMLAKAEAKLKPQIEDAERRARAAGVSPVVAELAGAGVDARWDALTVEQRREIVRVLLHVTVLPTTRPRGSTGFDPAAVRLDWRV